MVKSAKATEQAKALGHGIMAGTDSGNPIALVAYGATGGLVAVLLMRSVFIADDIGSYIQRVTRLPRYLRPALAGRALGMLFE